MLFNGNSTYNMYTDEAHTVKPVLSGQSKKDKTKVLMTSGIFMKAERNASLEHSARGGGAFCNTFDLYQR